MAGIKAKIGLREIQSQPPGPFLIWDTKTKGFNARRQFSDAITYSVIYRAHDGRQHWLKIGRHGNWTPEQARDKARSVLRLVDEGKDPAMEKYELRHGATVSELCDQYLLDMDLHKLNGKKASTIQSDKSRIKHHILPKLGKLRVATITRTQIEAFMHSCSSGSAKRIMQLLSSIFTFAVRKGLRETNPCSGIKKPPEVRKMRRLSDTEYAQLWKAIGGISNRTIADVFLALAITGWRSGEIINLRWDELDLPRQVANLSGTKAGASIRPLSVAAVKLIEAQPKTNEYVFALNGRKVPNLGRRFAQLGLDKEITPHVLRHSFASLSADMGLPDHTIARLLGHRQSSITSRYIHMEKSVIEASDLVANEVMRLMGRA